MNDALTQLLPPPGSVREPLRIPTPVPSARVTAHAVYERPEPSDDSATWRPQRMPPSMLAAQAIVTKRRMTDREVRACVRASDGAATDADVCVLQAFLARVA